MVIEQQQDEECLLPERSQNYDFPRNASTKTTCTPKEGPPKSPLLTSGNHRGLTTLLIASLVLNLLLVLQTLRSGEIEKAGCKSSLVGLEYDTSETLHWNSQYSSPNETDVDRLWNFEIPWESGIIALPNDEAKAKGLPTSQPFPWDPKNKSLYIINAHHILHCVRNIYIAIYEFRKGVPQSIEYPHLLHCLDSIRLETMCSADDTPRYVPANAMHGYRPGDGQDRKCRDWNALQRYVESHDPCYRYIEPGNKRLSNLERFKYCPEDSPYLPKIREYFGYDDDWMPEGKVR